MTSDLQSATLNTLWILPPKTSEAMAASKRPQRSLLTSKFDSVTLITHVTMLFWPLMATISRILYEDNYDPLTCVASPQVKMAKKKSDPNERIPGFAR